MTLSFYCFAIQKFLERNEGELISTFGGTIVAILAAFLTYFLSKYQAVKKERNKYQGLLYTVYIELIWHKSHFEKLIKTIDRIGDISITEQFIITDSAPMQFNLALIENGLNQIIEYKSFNQNLVVLTTSYLNNLRDINYFLEFSTANKVLQNQSDKSNIENQIKGYFETLKTEYINKTLPVIPDLMSLIEKEIKDYIVKRRNKMEKKSP